MNKIIQNYNLTKTLPNFILAGFSKCATTSIAKYLGMHPSICFSNPKEPNFFLANGDYPDESWDEYSRCFNHVKKITVNETLNHQWLIKKCVNTSKSFYQIEPYLELFPRENIWR